MDAANTDGARLRREQKMFSNATDSLSPRKLALKDWEYLLKNWELRNNEEIVDILLKFIGTVDETYVPLTGYGLGYYLTYPFVESCPMEIIYCDLSTNTGKNGVYFKSIWVSSAYIFKSLSCTNIHRNTSVSNGNRGDGNANHYVCHLWIRNIWLLVYLFTKYTQLFNGRPVCMVSRRRLSTVFLPILSWTK